jgi:hypothetical protein
VNSRLSERSESADEGSCADCRRDSPFATMRIEAVLCSEARDARARRFTHAFPVLSVRRQRCAAFAGIAATHCGPTGFDLISATALSIVRASFLAARHDESRQHHRRAHRCESRGVSNDLLLVNASDAVVMFVLTMWNLICIGVRATSQRIVS